MGKEFKQFFVNNLIILAVTIAVSQLLFSTVFETNRFPGRIISIGFVWLVTCVFHFWMMKTVKDKPKAFSRVFMLQTTIKLLLYMVCIVVYLILYRQYGVPFTVHFLVIYLIFAIFEVVSILKFVKNNTGQVPGSIKKSN